MIDTMDETEIKKRLLQELQGQMAGRRVSPILEIEISAGGDDDDATETPGAEDDVSPGGDLEGSLEEPTDVKGRLGQLLKSKGLLG